MTNVTLALDDQVVKKVRKLAVDRDTTLTGMVRNYLDQLAVREDRQVEETISALRESFDASRLAVGKRRWTREDLHVR